MTLEQREIMESGLDDPGDPYGLANKPQFVVDYMAAKFDDHRYERCRRIRVQQATQRRLEERT